MFMQDYDLMMYSREREIERQREEECKIERVGQLWNSLNLSVGQTVQPFGPSPCVVLRSGQTTVLAT